MSHSEPQPQTPPAEEPLARTLLGIDVRALAAFRVGLALMLLADLAGRCPYLAAHYTDGGVLPRGFLVEQLSGWRWSLHWLNGTPVFAALLFAAAALFALMMLVGYRTRLATVVSWVLLLSLHNRNLLLLNGGDMVLRMVLFWAMFLPLGACASVDRRLGGGPRGAPQVVLSAGTVALLLQVVFVYLFSALLKTSAEWRSNGTAMYYAMNIDYITKPLGQWLLQFPTLLRVMSVSAFWFELVGPLAAFIPWGTRYWRTAVVALFIAFHVQLALTMELILFPYICMVAWLAFLPTWAWDKLAAIKPLAALAVGGGKVLDGIARAIEAAARRADWLRPPARTYRPSLVMNCVVGLLLAYVLAWNMQGVLKKFRLPQEVKQASGATGQKVEDAVQAFAVPGPLRGPASLLGIAQNWNMFAPKPLREDGWWVMPAELADGTRVDLYRGIDVAWEKPRVVSAEFSSHRWRKYAAQVWGRYRNYTPYYARWLRSDWNARHGPERRITSMQIYFMLEYTRPPGEPPFGTRLLVYEWDEKNGDHTLSVKENRADYKRQMEAAEEG